jgi:hypothetical protein
MRTTLTLEDDVSAELDALRRKQGLSLKDAVNNALRRGLRALAEGDQPRPPFVTNSVKLGLARLSLDNISEALATAEGESFR